MSSTNEKPENPPTIMIRVVGPNLLLINNEHFEVLRYSNDHVVTDNRGFIAIKKISTCELRWLEVEGIDHSVFLG